ncbi:MAG: DsbA family protein [Planctomycetota bacterium]|jgi:protein-disulfide isomerase
MSATAHTDRHQDGGGAPVAAVPPATHAAGLIFIALAIVGSLVLTLQHLAGMSLPGCGPQSACALLAKSAWGSVPGLGWPVSYLGLAYFIGLFIAWLMIRPGVPRGLAWLIRIGAAASVMFVVVMVVEGHFCQYCLAVHGGNLALLAMSELAAKRAGGSKPALGVVAAGFVVASLALLVAQQISGWQAQQRAEDDLADSTRQIIERGGQGGGGFTGRYRRGDEATPIRIVMWVSYQCVDCKRIEAEAEQLLRTRDDLSLSIKHFPMSNSCNPYMGSRNIHPNSCWAARAAEAAGMLRGPDGFWQMHDWLFARDGSFTDAQLNQGLAQMGYDTNEFIPVMTGEETLRRVKADIEEAVSFGLHYTPFIFVNGIELRGWTAPNALTRLVQQVAATNPPARTADADQPPVAIEKYIEDWRQQRRMPIETDPVPHALGNVGAPVQIVAWVDYEHASTARLNVAARELVGTRDDVAVEFRHYPMDQSCNTFAQRTAHPNACRMAHAVEAAGILGGPQMYWRMHEWLLATQETFSEEALLAMAADLGLSSEAFISTMESDEVRQAILSDAQASRRVGLRSVPWIFVNGRRLPRWEIQGDAILEEIAEVARQEMQR